MILAIDMGGTKTLLGEFDNSGKLLRTQRFETPRSYDEYLEVFRREVTHFLKGKSVDGAVMAVPGKLDRAKGVAIAFGNLEWENVPIGRDISRIVGVPVHIENDANLAGLGEAVLAPEYAKVLYVTVSTGIGGAYIVNGRLDPSMIDAEIGHMMLEHEGRLCTWESFASGRALYARFGKKASELTEPGEWYIVARNIAIGLINVIATTTPDVVVMGGGVGTHLDNFKDRLELELDLYSTSVVRIPPIIKAKNPEEAVLYGCYALNKK